MMLERFRRKSVYDTPIRMLMIELNKSNPGSEEFNDAFKKLSKLEELKEKENQRRISKDTLLIVGGNLLGILVIVAYEQKHVMVSRALNFVNRSDPKIRT